MDEAKLKKILENIEAPTPDEKRPQNGRKPRRGRIQSR
jgi:hypothetical protein